MKNKAILLSLIFCTVLTGCYPTGQKVEQAETSSIVYDEDLNASPRENLKYYFTVPEEYLQTYSAKKAQTIIYESDYITPLFPGCTEDLEQLITPETADSPDLEHYYLFWKGNASYVCINAGSVGLCTPEYNDNMYSLFPNKGIYLREEKEREMFPDNKLDSFSSDEAIEKMKEMADYLNADISEEPIIIAIDDEAAEILRRAEGFDIPSISKGMEAYYIRYMMTLDGLPLPDYSRSPLVHEDWGIPTSYVEGVFTSDSMIYFDCREAMEITERGEEIQICTPEFAIQQVKNYVEAMTVSCSVYGCELMVLPIYDTETDDKYDYKLKPVWMFVWDKTKKEDYPDCDAIYVDAETGEIL